METENSMVQCPYNSSHRMLRKKLQLHIIKCRLNYPDMELQQCPFNACHMVPENDFNHHVRNCPNKNVLLAYKYNSLPMKEEEEPRTIQKIIESEENWNDEEVEDYKPKQKKDDKKGNSSFNPKHTEIKESDNLSCSSVIESNEIQDGKNYVARHREKNYTDIKESDNFASCSSVIESNEIEDEKNYGSDYVARHRGKNYGDEYYSRSKLKAEKYNHSRRETPYKQESKINVSPDPGNSYQIKSHGNGQQYNNQFNYNTNRHSEQNKADSSNYSRVQNPFAHRNRDHQANFQNKKSCNRNYYPDYRNEEIPSEYQLQLNEYQRLKKYKNEIESNDENDSEKIADTNKYF